MIFNVATTKKKFVQAHYKYMYKSYKDLPHLEWAACRLWGGKEAGQDSFLWGYLKKRFSDIVVEAVWFLEIDTVAPVMTQRVMGNFWELLHQHQLLHLYGIILKTH